MAIEKTKFSELIYDDMHREMQPTERTDALSQTAADESPLTFIHITMRPSPRFVSDWWCNIRENTFLFHPSTGEQLLMQLALNVPVHPKKHFFKKFDECIHVTLVFDVIPKSWSCFDLVEDNLSPMNGYTYLNIPRNNSGVYRL